MAIAIFASKSFQVSSRKIYTFTDFATSTELQTESQDVAGKKPSTYIKGPGLDPLKFAIPIKSEFGYDPMNEYNSWKALMEAEKAYPFIIGGKPFGKFKWLLKSVGMENADYGVHGNITSATLQVSFEEYVRSGSAKTTSSKTSTTGTYVDQFVNTPTTDQKAAAKRYNPNTKIFTSGRQSDAV